MCIYRFHVVYESLKVKSRFVWSTCGIRLSKFERCSTIGLQQIQFSWHLKKKSKCQQENKSDLPTIFVISSLSGATCSILFHVQKRQSCKTNPGIIDLHDSGKTAQHLACRALRFLHENMGFWLACDWHRPQRRTPVQGPMFHKDLGMDGSKMLSGYSMVDLYTMLWGVVVLERLQVGRLSLVAAPGHRPNSRVLTSTPWRI
jgi:hypothetical protein